MKFLCNASFNFTSIKNTKEYKKYGLFQYERKILKNNIIHYVGREGKMPSDPPLDPHLVTSDHANT